MVLVDVDAGCWTIALGAVVVVAVVVVGVVGVASWPGRVIVVVAVEGGTVTGGVVVVVRRATTGEVVVVRGPAGMSMSGGAVVVVVVGAMIDDAGCTHNVAGTAMTPAVAASAAKSGRRNMPTTVPDLTAARNPATPTYAVRLSLPLPSSQYRGPGTPVADRKVPAVRPSAKPDHSDRRAYQQSTHPRPASSARHNQHHHTRRWASTATHDNGYSVRRRPTPPAHRPLSFPPNRGGLLIVA